MLQNFANSLLGFVCNPNQEAAAAEGVENLSNNIISRTEDEWVFVDLDSEGLSDTSSVGSIDVEAVDLEDCELSIPIRFLSRASSTELLLEDSWFITPPPCFTSEGPIDMETSPLENLLIEHPSMSVYHIGRRSTTAPCRLSSDSSQYEEEDVDVETISTGTAATLDVPPRNQRAVLVQQQNNLQKLTRRAQKVQMQKVTQPFKKSQLERCNKARDVDSHSRRKRRSERPKAAIRSFGNYTRKC